MANRIKIKPMLEDSGIINKASFIKSSIAFPIINMAINHIVIKWHTVQSLWYFTQPPIISSDPQMSLSQKSLDHFIDLA